MASMLAPLRGSAPVSCTAGEQGVMTARGEALVLGDEEAAGEVVAGRERRRQIGEAHVARRLRPPGVHLFLEVEAVHAAVGEDLDDLDAADFDEDGSRILHAGDVDGVDIDELADDDSDDDDEDDDDSDDEGDSGDDDDSDDDDD